MELAGPASAAYVTSIFWGAFTIGRLLGIPLAIRLKPQVMLTLDFLGAVASMLVILSYPGSLTALGIGSAGLGPALATIFPSMLVLAENKFPLTGRTNSYFFVGAATGVMLLPWLIGQLFQQFGPEIVMWMILIDLLALGAILIATQVIGKQPHR